MWLLIHAPTAVLLKKTFMLGHSWVITFYIKPWMWLLISMQQTQLNHVSKMCFRCLEISAVLCHAESGKIQWQEANFNKLYDARWHCCKWFIMMSSYNKPLMPPMMYGGWCRLTMLCIMAKISKLAPLDPTTWTLIVMRLTMCISRCVTGSKFNAAIIWQCFPYCWPFVLGKSTGPGPVIKTFMKTPFVSCLPI